MDIDNNILGDKISKKVFYLDTGTNELGLELSFNTAFTSFLYDIINTIEIDGCSEEDINLLLNLIHRFKDFATNEEPFMELNNHYTSEEEIKKMYWYTISGLSKRLDNIYMYTK